MWLQQQHDRELRDIKRKMSILYRNMGSPNKPKKIKKYGKYGKVSYEDAPLSLNEMLDKMMKVEFE